MGGAFCIEMIETEKKVNLKRTFYPKSHYNYRDDFAWEKFKKVKILVSHNYMPQKYIKTIFRV